MAEQALRAVALMGATASGKSALAMSLAQMTGTIIICCDSMQVYQGLDIGTAKASVEDQARVPHAMLDCCTLHDAFSAARWAALVAEIIRRENDAGRLPLIVGGTGLYLRALIQGLADIPEEGSGIRNGLMLRLQTEGIESLHAELSGVDAATAARLAVNDTQRIIRALSVYHSSGRALSAWIAEGNQAPACDIPVFVLDVPRALLREQIAGRFAAMLDAGWLDELRWLGGFELPDTHPALRAVGYRQLLVHARGECDLQQAVRDGVTATRRYAKRQQTWFAHQTPQAVHGDSATLGTMIAPLLVKAVQA
ncbi:MAG: tRNA (adenosine(37)-N6)-dimethylallyltransferase MiaA [Mariprofundaceae bacterium]|nr:tRNA (adenosine(37)-N6)-dimethylallyltransferase MiaA [Mariprofundaceae bacterium]